ncbi:GumC family protein [Polymorphum gilvum]|nr:GumC family protein [Polymorphum gilvum]
MRDVYQPQDLALDLSGLLRAIRGSLRWLLPLVLVVAATVFLLLQFVPEKYKGEAKVLIESTDAIYPGASRGVEDERALLDTEGVASQVQLLTSADLARRVAQRLDLVSIPEFDAARTRSILTDALVLLGLRSDPARVSPEERVLKHYYKHLDVYRLDGSRVIAVEYSAEDPQLAAAVANTILDEYLAMQSKAKRETTEFTAASLEPQIERLRKEVQDARKAVEDFRAHADLMMGSDNRTLNQQQLAEISTQQSSAQASEAEATAKARLIRGLLNSGGSFETASDVLNSPLIQRLRERQVAIQSRIAELSTTMLSNHPQIRALNSQLADYDTQIRSEARKILIGLENDAKVARQQAEALRDRLSELKVAAARTNTDQVRLRELEREAEAKATQLDTLLASYREADTRRSAQTLPADARVISRASVPIEPYAPKVALFTIIAALATFVLGCAFVVMREFLSGNALQPIDYGHGEAIAVAPAPVAEAAVAAQPVAADACGPSDMPPADPRTERVRAAAHPAAAASPRRSAPSGLGRREEAYGPAAEDGQKSEQARRIVVLSVDDAQISHDLAFDLVRAAADRGDMALLMEVFPENEDPGAAAGFSDLVAGKASFSSVIYRDAGSRAHIIEAGRFALADAMVADGRFSRVLDAIDATYGTVVVDLGTIDGSLASARILEYADRVIVVSQDETETPGLRSAARLLSRNTGAEVIVRTHSGERGPVRRSTRRSARGVAA